MDGNAVNRRLIKMHDDQTELVYKTPNPFADDEVVPTKPVASAPPRRLMRRSSSELEDLSSDFLVKTTLTKTRSMVGAVCFVCYV